MHSPLSSQAAISSVHRPVPAFATDVLVDVPELGRTCRRVDIYDAWRFADAEAETALRTWACADARDRGDRHVAYRAALDREETAATVLAAAIRAPGRGR
jgi:hypothetical protein